MKDGFFNLVLLIRDQETSREIGPSLWAALEEAVSLYNKDEQRFGWERYYLAKVTPEGINQGSGFNPEKIEAAMNSSEWWRSFKGWSPNHPPLDQAVLLSHVAELLAGRAAEAEMIMVTDLEIKPPEGWRYVIWLGNEMGSVISLTPTDPEFWGLKEFNRTSIIKHRVRTAVCSSIGERLGFVRCSNPQCLLYHAVESANHLDSMIIFGKEHGVPELTGWGFLPMPDEPRKVQYPQDLSASVNLAYDYPAMSADWL